ncbi:MAG TPA: hypothetical protein VF708_06060 [Pyrinomonadaceae bacterium]|jgi:hypothetical protein
MSPRSRQAARTVAAFLIIALLQVYVLADATRPTDNTAAASGTQPRAEPSSMIFGKLNLHGSRRVFVNGNSAESGTTIFSGAQLQTPEGTEATVLLGSIGHVDIAPNSKLTLTFDKASVDVLVLTGNAVLSTNAGVTGTVRSADGKLMNSSPTSAGAVVGLPPAGSSTRAAAATTTEEKLSFIIIPIVIAAVIIAVAVNNGGDDDNTNNVSQSAPPNL